LEGLRGKEIILQKSAATHEYFVKNKITDRIVLANSTTDALRLLSSGNHDYVLAQRLVGLIAIKELGLTNLDVTGPLLTAFGRGFGFAVKEGNTELLDLLNQGLQIIKATGRYDEIYEKWFGLVDPKGIPTAVIFRYLAWGAVGIVILIALPLGWSVSLRSKVTQRTLELHEDITARKRVERDLAALNENLEQRVEERTAELRSTQDSLLRKERLAALGQLTGTVAHELRNPLGAIATSVAVIRQKSADTDLNLKAALGRVDRSIGRCDSIITELLDFARAKGLQTVTTALDPWLSGVLDEQDIPEGITVKWHAQTNGAIVRFDPDALRRAAINVMDNACDAMTNEGGERDQLVAAELTVATRANTGRIEIEIADTGPGIPAEVLPKILEPLFSTKPFGTGLGLPTVQRIMEDHGGGLDIYSVVGRGTQVVLWLPPFEGIVEDSKA
jgi:signal transduction histidine kinase